jgi:histidine ammonia-lyase
MEVLSAVRARVPRLERDRFMAPDLALAKEIVVAGELDRFVGNAIVPSLMH